MKRTIQFQVNGQPRTLSVEDDRALLWALRVDLGLTGCKYGCGEGLCGACTVLVDGEAVRSCQYPIREIDGKEVVTIEGLTVDGELHPLQKAFMQHDALQCGYCTAYTLLSKKKNPSRTEIIDTMDDSLCRCGAHTRILQAIQTAAVAMNGGQGR